MRTKKSILNFITSFFPWLILAVLGFIKIKYFIQFFGSEMNGLIQLAGQIYAYLTLMEIGFGTAIVFKLYKPFAKQDKKKISELFIGSQQIFKKIGIMIFIGGFITALITPFVIKRGEISSIYVFLIFLLYAFDYLTLYLLSLPYQSLLTADQQKYKVNLIINIRHLAVKSLEIVLILMKVDILLILLVGIIANIIASRLIKQSVKKLYPWLDSKAKPDLTPFEMTKDVIFHKIAKLVSTNTDAIILSIATNLKTVSIYGSYNYIIVYLRQIISMIFSAPLDSFGNIFNDNKITAEKKKELFDEFRSIGLYIALIFTPVLYISFLPFVISWIDLSYKISSFAIILFSINLWFQIILYPLTIVRNANGLYKESKKYTLSHALLNLILSVILVWKFGIIGVLLGTTISLILVAYIFEIKLVTKNILKISFLDYIKYDIFSSMLLSVIIPFTIYIKNILKLYQTQSLWNWFYETAIVFTIVFIIVTVIFVIFVKPYKKFLIRIKGLVSKKFKK